MSTAAAMPARRVRIAGARFKVGVDQHADGLIPSGDPLVGVMEVFDRVVVAFVIIARGMLNVRRVMQDAIVALRRVVNIVVMVVKVITASACDLRTGSAAAFKAIATAATASSSPSSTSLIVAVVRTPRRVLAAVRVAAVRFEVVLVDVVAVQFGEMHVVVRFGVVFNGEEVASVGRTSIVVAARLTATTGVAALGPIASAAAATSSATRAISLGSLTAARRLAGNHLRIDLTRNTQFGTLFLQSVTEVVEFAPARAHRRTFLSPAVLHFTARPIVGFTLLGRPRLILSNFGARQRFGAESGFTYGAFRNRRRIFRSRLFGGRRRGRRFRLRFRRSLFLAPADSEPRSQFLPTAALGRSNVRSRGRDRRRRFNRLWRRTGRTLRRRLRIDSQLFSQRVPPARLFFLIRHENTFQFVRGPRASWRTAPARGRDDDYKGVAECCEVVTAHGFAAIAEPVIARQSLHVARRKSYNSCGQYASLTILRSRSMDESARKLSAAQSSHGVAGDRGRYAHPAAAGAQRGGVVPPNLMEPIEDVEVRGHIIDSLILPKILDIITGAGGAFRIKNISIGQARNDVSYALVEVRADTEERLNDILAAVADHGAVRTTQTDCELVVADIAGAFPEGFYSTTNQRTEVRLGGHWREVARQEMDCGVVVDDEGIPHCLAMTDVKVGERIVCGHSGVRVIPQERSIERHGFEFMNSAVSTEKPKGTAIREIARELVRTKRTGGKTLIVGGPAIIHTGSGEHLCRLIRAGYVDKLFAGNALATHDIEQSLFGTSLGVRLDEGISVEAGHEHHLRAINRIRRLGGIRQAVESGVLTSGIMFECVKHDVEFLLAGSIRDDGPLPDVITDTLEAQRAMRDRIRDVTFCLMIATTLHSVAVGNLLPAWVKVVCVDINPSTVIKLNDRGSFQTVGLVTDVEPFLRALTQDVDELSAAKL